MLPQEIETESFAIIAREAGSHGFPPDQWAVVRRVIHTSADFDYLSSIRFHPRAVEAGIAALRAGAAIVTDTQMVRAGIRKRDLAGFRCETVCLMDSAGAAEKAAREGTTRAHAAVDLAVKTWPNAIYAVGNAPTALLRLMELIGQGKATPALVAGFPVGFVNAAESKAALAALDTPHITNAGRKGGSNVAAAVINALILLAREQQGA
jgi:precorrin-8X/cobalt-precorrin-8 methylmutase